MVISSIFKSYLVHFPVSFQKIKKNKKKILPENVSYISSKKVFVIFWELKFSSSETENPLISSQKKFIIFWKVKLPSLNLKRFLMFFLKNIFLIFEEGTGKD